MAKRKISSSKIIAELEEKIKLYKKVEDALDNAPYTPNYSEDTTFLSNVTRGLELAIRVIQEMEG